MCLSQVLYHSLKEAVAAHRGELPISNEAVTPLLEAYGHANERYHLGHVMSLTGNMCFMVLSWVMGLGIR